MPLHLFSHNTRVNLVKGTCHLTSPSQENSFQSPPLENMLRRQDSSLSSSHRHPPMPTSPEDSRAKAIGCMSGIIHLFSKYHKPKRRLTFGKKQEKTKKSSTTNPKNRAPPEEKGNGAEKQSSAANCDIETLRSPSLPPEIRLSAVARSPENSTSPCSFMPVAEESVCEKRRLLLQALEKCNEDLEALKRIIREVQTANLHRIPPPSPGMTAVDRGVSGGMTEVLETTPCMEKFLVATDHELNSPICVASELAPAPVGRRSFSITAYACEGLRKTPQQLKPGEQDEPVARLLDRPTTIVSRVWIRRRATTLPPRSSEAMVKNVEEVCNEVACGEKREIGRLGLVLQDHLCRELVEELVGELKSFPLVYSLPLGACRRRLSY